MAPSLHIDAYVLKLKWFGAGAPDNAPSVTTPGPTPASAMSDTTSSTSSANTSTTVVSGSFLQVIAHYHVKPGLGDQVGALLVELTEATRREVKNLAYAFYRSPQDPDRYVILEQYTDASGLDDHRASEHFQRLGFGTIIPMLVSREVTSYVVRTGVDGKPVDAVKA